MSTSDRSKHTVALALFVTTSIQAIVTMATLTVSIYAPQAARDIGVAPEYIGVYASLTYVGAMLGSLLAGGFVLRFGAIRFSQGVMTVCALGLLLCIGAHWIWFVISALVLGFGYGPTTPASSHLLSRHTPERALSLVFSIKQTGVPLGSVLAGALVPLLLIEFSWQVVSVVVAGFVFLSAVVLTFFRQRFDRDLRPAEPLLRGNVVGPLRLIFSRPGLRSLAIGTFFFSSSQQSFVYFLVTYLEVDIGWTTRDAGLALSVVGLAAVVGRMLWGALADATRRSREILGLLALLMALATATTAAFTSDWSTTAIYLVCALFGATGAAWNGIYLAEITRHVKPEEVSRATGGGLFVTFAGVVVTPPLFGLSVQITGSFVAGYLALASAAAVTGILFLATRRPVNV